MNEYLLSVVVDRKCNCGSSLGWNCPKAGREVVTNGTLVRHPRQTRGRLLDFCEVSIRYVTSRLPDNPPSVRFQIP